MLGVVRYCNALPISARFKEDAELRLVRETPSRLYSALKEGKLSATLTSSSYLLDEELFSFSPFCIAAYQKVLSVRFYYKGKLSALSGKRIALTDESNSSAALLRLLCHFHWKISPLFETVRETEPLENYEGILWIGDRALQRERMEGYQVIDLASAWYEMTALPFVFALFFAKVQERENPLLQKIEDRVSTAVTLGLFQIEEIVARVVREKNLPLSLIKEYYTLLRYSLHAEEKRGLSQFITLYKAYENDLL